MYYIDFRTNVCKIFESCIALTDTIIPFLCRIYPLFLNLILYRKIRREFIKEPALCQS